MLHFYSRASKRSSICSSSNIHLSDGGDIFVIVFFQCQKNIFRLHHTFCHINKHCLLIQSQSTDIWIVNQCLSNIMIMRPTQNPKYPSFTSLQWSSFQPKKAITFFSPSDYLCIFFVLSIFVTLLITQDDKCLPSRLFSYV